MRKHFTSTLALTAFLTFSSSFLFAQTLEDSERKHYENTGVVSGAVIGGLLAGPPGAIVSAGIGGWLSDKFLASKENRLLRAHLSNTQDELLALMESQKALEDKYQLALTEVENIQFGSASYPSRVAQGTMLKDIVVREPACCADSKLILHFRSSNSVIEQHYYESIRDFVELANLLPDAIIEISGHADRRGEDASNLALSQQRIQLVENQLRVSGLHNSAVLQTNAYGEDRPVSDYDDFENNFFDRRVELTLRSNNFDFISSSIK